MPDFMSLQQAITREEYMRLVKEGKSVPNGWKGGPGQGPRRVPRREQ